MIQKEVFLRTLDIPLDADGKPLKKVVATTSLAGCFGCHMSMLDVDLGIVDLLEMVEFNKSPITDIKKFTKRADIGLIEGGCCNTENIEVLRDLELIVISLFRWANVPFGADCRPCEIPFRLKNV